MLLLLNHSSVSRLYGDSARLAGMDGKNTGSARAIGSEYGCGNISGSSDSDFRAHILLCDMPAGRDAGHRVVDKQPAQKEEIPFLLFTRQKSATLYRVHPLRNCHDRRRSVTGSTAGTIQCLRPHSAKPILSALPVGKQSVGLSIRTSR